MPGIANWKVLYRLEYEALHEEGYDVSGCPAPGDDNYIAVEGAPAPPNDDDMGAWKDAYEQLWKTREKGLRPDYPYVEPNDYDAILADAPSAPELEPLDAEEYRRRIDGAWRGRCAGVIQGKPVEMWLKPKIKKFLQATDAWPLEDFVPWEAPSLGETGKCQTASLGRISCVEIDDDTSYTLLGLLLMEHYGREFTQADLCKHWLRNIPYGCLYSATKQAYYRLVSLEAGESMEALIEELARKYNPMREGLNGAIRADIYGYVAPGDPREAARLAHREMTINMAKNGVYCGMFVAGCIAAALSKSPTVETILQGGLCVIPKRSRLYEAIEQTRQWYAETGEWEPVCDKIYERWGHLNWAGAMFNYPIVALSLLHGKMDFPRTIGTATMCGVDTDCNAGTVGSILGAALGTEGIDRRFIDPFNDRIKTFVAGNGHGDGTITDLVNRTVAVGWREAR